MRGKWSEVLTSFTCGCCYWFAFILCNRFPEAVIMYDPVINHFVTQIDGRLYDITGEVTQEYKVVRWDTYEYKDGKWKRTLAALWHLFF